jgi:hypothetical protein
MSLIFYVYQSRDKNFINLNESSMVNWTSPVQNEQPLSFASTSKQPVIYAGGINSLSLANLDIYKYTGYMHIILTK